MPALDSTLAFALTGFSTLFAIVDPVGNVGPFLGVTADMAPAERKRTAARACLLALGVPVWATRDKVLASLGLACPGFRATLAHGQDMLDALWKIAASLSRELGCAQPPLSQPHLRRLTPPRSRKEATR